MLFYLVVGGIILLALAVLALILFIAINFEIICRNKNTIIYFLFPFVAFLTATLCTCKYGTWYNFGISLLNPVTLILAIISFFLFTNCFGFSIGILLYKRFIKSIDMAKYVICVDGFFGAGKTSSTSERCVLMAEMMWAKIKFNYWLLRNTKKKWKGNRKYELDYDDYKSAYEYWTANKDYFPCLMSNIDHYDSNNKIDSGVIVDGKKVKRVNFKMLNMEARIPFGTVVHVEELGDWLGNEWSDKEGKAALEGASRVVGRYPRHNGFYFVINDQDCNNLFINIRRGVSLNQLMVKQKWICRPKLLIIVQSVIMWFVRKFRYHDSKFWALFMLKLGKLINSIGFRKYWSELRGNTQNGVTDKIGRFVFCIPSILLARFDDRYKRAEYTPEEFDKLKTEETVIKEALKAESLILAKQIYKIKPFDNLVSKLDIYKKTAKLADDIQKDPDLKDFIQSELEKQNSTVQPTKLKE